MNIWDYFEHLAKESNCDIEQELMQEYYIKKCGNVLEPLLEHFEIGQPESRYPDLISFFRSCEYFADNVKDSFADLGKFYPEFQDEDFIQKYYEENRDFLIDVNDAMAQGCSMSLSKFFSEFVTGYEDKDLAVELLRNPDDPKVKKQLVLTFFSQEILKINDISKKEAIDDFPRFQKLFFKEHISGFEKFQQEQEQKALEKEAKEKETNKKKKFLGIF